MSGPSPQAVRDVLLPGLLDFRQGHNDIDLSIAIDGDGLIVTGVNKATNYELGFALTAGQLADGSYKQRFRPALEHLLELLDPTEDYNVKKATAAKAHAKASPPPAKEAPAQEAAPTPSSADRKDAGRASLEDVRALLADLRAAVADPALKGRCDEALAKLAGAG